MILPLADDFLKTLKKDSIKILNFFSLKRTYLVACLFELASSMSGSGEGLGDFEEDCICADSC